MEDEIRNIQCVKQIYLFIFECFKQERFDFLEKMLYVVRVYEIPIAACVAAIRGTYTVKHFLPSWEKTRDCLIQKFPSTTRWRGLKCS